MSWARMMFKGQTVFVRVDGRGKPVLDADGRAEMKYREADTKVYRPAPGNLIPADPGAEPAPPRRPRPAPSPASDPDQTLDDKPPGARVDVWTDGACSGNPGPMGIGVVVIADGKRRELGEYLGVGTNNIAE